MFWEDIELTIKNDDILYKKYLEEMSVLKYTDYNLQYERNCKIIKNILGSISTQDVKKYLGDLPKFMRNRFISDYWERYQDCIQQNIDYLNDVNLKDKFIKIYNIWNNILEVGKSHYDYVETTNSFVYYMPMDVFISNRDENDYKEILNLSAEMLSEIVLLEDYIIKEYKEIDLLELSETGRKLSDDFDRKYNSMFSK